MEIISNWRTGTSLGKKSRRENSKHFVIIVINEASYSWLLQSVYCHKHSIRYNMFTTNKYNSYSSTLFFLKGLQVNPLYVHFPYTPTPLDSILWSRNPYVSSVKCSVIKFCTGSRSWLFFDFNGKRSSLFEGLRYIIDKEHQIRIYLFSLMYVCLYGSVSRDFINGPWTLFDVWKQSYWLTCARSESRRGSMKIPNINWDDPFPERWRDWNLELQ